MASKGPNDLDYIVDKLEDWYAEVTGEDLKKREEMKADEFLSMGKKIVGMISSARKVQEERNAETKKDNHSAAVVLRKTQALKESFDQIEDSIKGLGKVVERNRKKFGEAESAKRLKIQANYFKILENLKESEKFCNTENVKKPKKKPVISDSIDFELGEDDLNGSLIKDELDEKESEALHRFKEKDKKIENLLDAVITGLGNIDSGLDEQASKIAQNKKTADQLEGHVDKLNTKFDTTNEKLKKILVQFRSPSHFCMDLILIIIFLVMLGLFYKVVIK